MIAKTVERAKKIVNNEHLRGDRPVEVNLHATRLSEYWGVRATQTVQTR